MKKTFTIHAGTHKTASTYIQSRLWRNRMILEKHGIKLLYSKEIKSGWFKDFAKWVEERNYRKVKSELKHIKTDAKHIVISAEQFARVLLTEERVDELRRILARFGYKLNIIIFLRDQPDYINSTYVQEVRRFYHSLDIPAFIKKCRKKRELKFNYEKMFSHLIENKNINITFLPYCSSLGDPFLRLITSLNENLPEDIEWIPANPNNANDQPGIKGVWLALEACKRMKTMGVNLKLLQDESMYIRKYSIPREWSKNRFYGLKPKKVNKIREYYRSSNDRFAQLAWRKETWADVYKNLRQEKYNIMDESSLIEEDMQEMKNLVTQVVSDIRERNPDAFPKA